MGILGNRLLYQDFTEEEQRDIAFKDVTTGHLVLSFWFPPLQVPTLHRNPLQVDSGVTAPK